MAKRTPTEQLAYAEGFKAGVEFGLNMVEDSARGSVDMARQGACAASRIMVSNAKAAVAFPEWERTK